MNKPPKKDTQPLGNDIPQMPFNEALKRVWAAKPKHKVKLKPIHGKKKPGE